MPMIKAGDADLYYERHGAGPPLLLVPGLGGTAHAWRGQVADFAKHFEVILHDHRGAGRSTMSPIAYSIGQMAADTIALMDALKIERAHYVGHSTGGAMGQAIALDYPGRLASLVLSATWPKSDAFFKRSFAARKVALEQGPAAYMFLSGLFLYPEWFINDRAEQLEQLEAAALAGFPPVEIMASRIDAICAHDRRAELGRIGIPALAICAEDDRTTPIYYSHDLAKLIPGLKLVTLKTGGHMCNVTVPEAYNPPVLDFLLAQAKGGRP